MNKTILLWMICGVAALVAATCFVILFQMKNFDETRVIFLDVGQGDAILITEGTNQILIDGGPNGTVLLEELGRYMPFWDRSLEVIIATHPDNDHINGLVDVLEFYDVDEFWHTGLSKDTAVYDALMRHAGLSGAHTRQAYSGMHVTTPRGGVLEVVYPFSEEYVQKFDQDINAASIATTFTLGEETFFFGGDLPVEIEDMLPLDAHISVLKAGHHGSDTSTSAQFLSQTTPRDVIFSVGGNNKYGHPHDDVVTRTLSSGARIFRTDREGSIIYSCNDKCNILFD